MSLLNGIITGIFGPDTSAMSEKDRQQTEQARSEDRSKAAGAAFNAQNDQGESFINGSEAVKAGDSSSDLLKTIGKVMSLFA
jgi:hypothetical protein